MLTVYSGRTEDLIGPLLERLRRGDGRRRSTCATATRPTSPCPSTRRATGRRPTSSSRRAPAPSASSTSEDRLARAARRRSSTWSPSEDRRRRRRAGSGSPAGCGCSSTTPTWSTEADLPESVLDLTDPSYDGQVAVAPTNGSFQDFVTAMRSELGDDEPLATGSTAWPTTTARPYANNVAIVEAVGRGEIADGPRQPLLQRPGRRPRTPTCPAANCTSSPTATSARCCSSPPPAMLDRHRPGRATPSSWSSSCSPRSRRRTSPRRPSSTRWSRGVEPRRGLPPLDDDRVDAGSTSTSSAAGSTDTRS